MGCGASRSGTVLTTGNLTRLIQIRIVLIGKTGTGKSTLGNAILGNAKFRTEGLPIESTTGSCEVGTAVIGDKEVVILDTPGAMVTALVQLKLQEELSKCTVKNLEPGPHVFLLVIRADTKFTEEEANAVKIFGEIFGEEMYKHLIVVFTHKSALDKSNKTAEDCLLKFPGDFLEKYGPFKECCFALETEGKNRHVKKEVAKLLQVVQKVIDRNNGSVYTDEKMKEADKAYKARIAKLQEKVKNETEKEKVATNKQGPRELVKELGKQAVNTVVDIVADKFNAAKSFFKQGE